MLAIHGEIEKNRKTPPPENVLYRRFIFNSYGYALWRIAMTTSVQVSERTLQLLNKLKQEEGLRSHDQVIRELISERKKIPKSMFGSNPRLRSFTAKDEAESHEL
jgi:hypothetical protein